MGVAGVEKGREGWGKGREDCGEKVADSLSFLFLFSLPPPSLALFTSPTQAFVAIVDKIYTWIFQSYSMFGIQKNSSSISHHEHILPKYQNFFILIGNYTYVYIQFITQITKLFASWVFLWPELKVDKKASVSFSLDWKKKRIIHIHLWLKRLKVISTNVNYNNIYR